MDPVLVGVGATVAAAVISVAIHLDGRRRSRGTPATPPPSQVVMILETMVVDDSVLCDQPHTGPASTHRRLRIHMTQDAQVAKAEWADDRSVR